MPSKKIQAQILGKTISSNSKEAYSISKKSHLGEHIGEKIIYLPEEAFYLLEKNKLEIIQKNKTFSKEESRTKLQRIDKKFSTKYPVFKDLKQKGYTLKTGLKFGADYRVYEKSKKPSEAHAKWILFIDHESNKISWQEFSAKNRVANSTKKKLLIAIVDNEEKTTYYEVKWTKP
jgi:tRNA-intron endonuclease, archaea type